MLFRSTCSLGVLPWWGFWLILHGLHDVISLHAGSWGCSSPQSQAAMADEGSSSGGETITYEENCQNQGYLLSLVNRGGRRNRLIRGCWHSLASQAARRAQEVAHARALELLALTEAHVGTPAVQECIHSPLVPSVCLG